MLPLIDSLTQMPNNMKKGMLIFKIVIEFLQTLFTFGLNHSRRNRRNDDTFFNDSIH